MSALGRHGQEAHRGIKWVVSSRPLARFLHGGWEWVCLAPAPSCWIARQSSGVCSDVLCFPLTACEVFCSPIWLLLPWDATARSV